MWRAVWCTCTHSVSLSLVHLPRPHSHSLSLLSTLRARQASSVSGGEVKGERWSVRVRREHTCVPERERARWTHGQIERGREREGEMERGRERGRGRDGDGGREGEGGRERATSPLR
eukprot:106141-Rhodomonas_salina.1